jgi:hypothetical protein
VLVSDNLGHSLFDTYNIVPWLRSNVGQNRPHRLDKLRQVSREFFLIVGRIESDVVADGSTNFLEVTSLLFRLKKEKSVVFTYEQDQIRKEEKRKEKNNKILRQIERVG